MTINDYLKLSYPIEIYLDTIEGGYTVSFPDLPGCLTCGETIEEAIEMAQDAKRIWLEAVIEDGYEIKLPDADLTLTKEETEEIYENIRSGFKIQKI